MRKKIKLFVATLAVLFCGMVALPAHAYKVYCPDGKTTVEKITDCPGYDDHKDDEDLMTTLTGIINVIIGIVGFLAVVMIIIGGISYTTSAGDANKVKKAKDTIMYGVIGLVVAILAFAIVNFVLGAVVGGTS